MSQNTLLHTHPWMCSRMGQTRVLFDHLVSDRTIVRGVVDVRPPVEVVVSGLRHEEVPNALHGSIAEFFAYDFTEDRKWGRLDLVKNNSLISFKKMKFTLE